MNQTIELQNLQHPEEQNVTPMDIFQEEHNEILIQEKIISEFQQALSNEQIGTQVEQHDTQHQQVSFIKSLLEGCHEMESKDAEQWLMTTHPRSLTMAVQMILMGQGYAIEDSIASGRGGASTEAALRDFQEKHGLEVTGKVTLETMRTLTL